MASNSSVKLVEARISIGRVLTCLSRAGCLASDLVRYSLQHSTDNSSVKLIRNKNNYGLLLPCLIKGMFSNFRSWWTSFHSISQATAVQGWCKCKTQRAFAAQSVNKQILKLQITFKYTLNETAALQDSWGRNLRTQGGAMAFLLE